MGSIIHSVLDSLKIYVPLDNKNIVYRPDAQWRKVTLIPDLEDFKDDFSPKTELLRKLQLVIEEDVDYHFERYNDVSKDYKLFDQDKVYLSETDSSFITMNLSQIAFDESKSEGCFYIDLICWDHCDSGFYVFISKNSKMQWAIDGVFLTWRSGLQ